jgi:hypothetical protein
MKSPSAVLSSPTLANVPERQATYRAEDQTTE